MDAKNIMAGICTLAIVTAAGKVYLTDKAPSELPVAAGATLADEAVAEIASLEDHVTEQMCCLEREQNGKIEVELAWYCGGKRAKAKSQTELWKAALPDENCISLVPRKDGAVIRYDKIRHKGVRPNTDPVPAEPVAELAGEKVGP